MMSIKKIMLLMVIICNAGSAFAMERRLGSNGVLKLGRNSGRIITSALVQLELPEDDNVNNIGYRIKITNEMIQDEQRLLDFIRSYSNVTCLDASNSNITNDQLSKILSLCKNATISLILNNCNNLTELEFERTNQFTNVTITCGRVF
jgi:hypothetical protein